MDFAAKFHDGLEYTDFLERHASATDQQHWQTAYEAIRLDDPQKALLRLFQRDMKVLVSAGAWCGDCVQQCPIFAHFAQETRRIQLRFFDREEHPDLAAEISTCGAQRVPSVLFLSEDGHVCGRYGDRTLAKYRQMVHDQLGIAPPATDDARTLQQRVTQEWLDEFERIQWMLRTSPRLRQRHGD